MVGHTEKEDNWRRNCSRKRTKKKKKKPSGNCFFLFLLVSSCVWSSLFL
uniref:Uncharacterized protein n=1 Tax=Anguilla anguilla TaxID=7936 RepID=A0A0E9W862_ANGAN